MPMLQTVFQPVMDVDHVDIDSVNRRFRLKATGGGFLAKLLGMATKATMTMDPSGFHLHKTTFGSEESTYIPRSKISSSVSIVMKPLEFLILGLFTLPFFGLGVIFIVVYFLSKKRVIIGVVSSGGTVESLKLKANAESLADAKEGMKILESLIHDDASTLPAPTPPVSYSNPGVPVVRSASPAPSPQSLPSEEATISITCPNCGTQMSAPQAAMGRKVRCRSCREVFVANA